MFNKIHKDILIINDCDAGLPQSGQEYKVGHLVKCLKSIDMYEREGAAAALSFMGPVAKAAIPALIEVVKEGLPDTRWHIRVSAIIALRKMGPEAKAAVPALIETLKDRDRDVREHAVKALGTIGIGDKTAVSALIEARKDQDIGVRNVATDALKAMMPWWSRLLIR